MNTHKPLKSTISFENKFIIFLKDIDLLVKA